MIMESRDRWFYLAAIRHLFNFSDYTGSKKSAGAEAGGKDNQIVICGAGMSGLPKEKSTDGKINGQGKNK